ncbi:MAG: stage V sporulation protein AC, partial [Oscillospiraceae bacterium]|nr:stage V sporulation protein AC [Oscillospiraceae bacterium]
EYNEYIKDMAPKSPLAADLAKAFLVGGLICCLGEGLSMLYGDWAGLGEEDAATAVSMTLVFLSALLTGLGVYDKLARFAGAGTLVPITGFANAVVSPALEFKTEGFILGTAVKMFTIAGPVITFGLSASVVYGLILCLLT